ncbi:MAG TPA: DUF3800 domain-containing protein [Dehalococcoidia bacterium]|nr:DUF3800 domain-containing protein [Dehalococcoidia bacterium]
MANRALGDPLGRRLAKRRATFLAEAGNIAHALKVLLARAEFDTRTCDELIAAIARQEQIELQRSHGRIESRKRFKYGSSHPLLDSRPKSNLYIDEGGKSNPEPLLAGPRYFALGAVALPEEEVISYCSRADEIKAAFFGRTDITFHEPEMRLFDGIYYFNGDRQRQMEFDQAIEQLIEGTNFVTFGVGVRKHGFETQFVEAGIDPYLPTDAYAVAITMLLERYIDFLANSHPKRLGHITFESQGPKEDAQHQLEYARVLLEGSQWVPGSAFQHFLVTGLQFTPKRGSDAMELADMFSRAIYEWVGGGCSISPARWDLFGRKIYCRGDGQMGKFGVKVFPDSDIRERIEAHRRGCGATSTN